MTVQTHSQDPARLNEALLESGADGLGSFRYRKVGERWFLSNEAGDWIALSDDDFTALIEGKVNAEHPRYQELHEKCFVPNASGIRLLSQRFRDRYRFLQSGPHLHAIITTLRCNFSCVYCHASRAPMHAQGQDMSPEVAKKAVDFIFRSPNPYINIEFQGGEPTVRYDIMQLVMEYAPQVARIKGKNLTISLVTNMSTMNEEMLEELCEKRVQVCASLDGHEDLHNKNRVWKEGNSFKLVAKWMKRFHERYAEEGLDDKVYKVDALLTVTRAALPHWKEIVDTYVGLGCHTISLRPMDPFGWGQKLQSRDRYHYSSEEFLHEFYYPALEYIIELNKQGVEILETQAATMLQKMLTPYDPNYVDLRSPSGSGIGQIAYSYDGRIYTCDEGRMVGHMGEDAFQIGDVETSSYQDVVEHPAVKSMALATLLDGLPDCEHCAWKPYCGQIATYNYLQQGNIFGQMRTSSHCQRAKSTFDWLFNLIETDEEARELLSRWTIVKPRELFVIR